MAKHWKLEITSILLFQSPCKFLIFVVTISIISKIPRFLQFELTTNGKDYKITDLMGDPTYIRFNSYWDEIIVTGFMPLILLMYFNVKLYMKVSLTYDLQINLFFRILLI